jgi:hypothetical protein
VVSCGLTLGSDAAAFAGRYSRILPDESLLGKLAKTIRCFEGGDRDMLPADRGR